MEIISEETVQELCDALIRIRKSVELNNEDMRIVNIKEGDILVYKGVEFIKISSAFVNEEITLEFKGSKRHVFKGEIPKYGYVHIVSKSCMKEMEDWLKNTHFSRPEIDFNLGASKPWTCSTATPLKDIQDLLNHLNPKQKTRYISFQFQGRLITLAGRNNRNTIEVGYSVYCDKVLDKTKPDVPEDVVRSKKIALGRLEKNPIYTIEVSEEAHRFIDTALDVARTKILKGELIIKGIR